MTLIASSWINAAHKNGVTILGTIIFEWDEGSKDLACLFGDIQVIHSYSPPPDTPQNDDTVAVAVDQLVSMAQHYGFDGWFINIECDLPIGDRGDRSDPCWILI